MRTRIAFFGAFLLLFAGQMLLAQVSGVVNDTDGFPDEGAEVSVKGKDTSTLTDENGAFTIDAVVGEDVLVIIPSDPTASEWEVNASSSSIGTLTNSTELDDLVVVAYGTRKREQIVGSVTSLGSEEIEKQQVTSPLRALQGTAPGVNLLTTGGQPGNNPDIRIRGFSSVNAAQSPLIVLDGVPYNGNINSISADQIESLNVLKDAASASLYGSRGANGVILITTKKGKRNREPEVSIRTQLGWASPAVGIHDLVDSKQYMQLYWQALKNDGVFQQNLSEADAGQAASNALVANLGYNPLGVDNPIDANGNLAPGANLLWNTNWEDLVLRDQSARENYNISISGGGDRSTYFFSVDYLDQEGSVINSDFERITTRLNLDTQVKDWLKVGVNTSFSRSDSGNPDQTSGSTTQAITWIYALSSIYPNFVRDANGGLITDNQGGTIFDLGNGNGRPAGQPVNNNRPVFGGEHILATLNLGREKRVRTSYVASAFAEAQITDGLSFRSSFGWENYLFDSYSFDDDQIGAASGVGGRVARAKDGTTTLNAIQSLNYAKDFGKHSVAADVLMEAYTLTSDTFSGQGTGLLPGQGQLGDTGTPENVGGFQISERINGYLGRVLYDYDDRYFIEGSVRRDGSTRFNKDVRWGTFFSFGASWAAHNESFIKSLGFVDRLQFRGSYGENGNSRGIGFFPGQGVFATGSTLLVDGFGGARPTSVPDPNLTWETTAQTNVGVDWGFFNNRFRGTIDWYNKESIDLILDVPVSPSAGFPGGTVRTNAGAVSNKGWEFAFNYDVFRKKNFRWTAGLNFFWNRDEVTEWIQDQTISGSKLFRVGESRFDFFLRDWAGVDPADGLPMWYVDVTDADGNVTGREVTKDYAQATRYLTGKNALPDVQGGFNSNFQVGNFDLSVLFNFSFGGWLLDSDYQGLVNPFDSPGRSAHPDAALAWQNVGDVTDFARLSASQNDFTSRSTRWLFKNDWVRLRALTVGYNFPAKTLDQIGLKRFRIYAQADNIFTWQSHPGIDPEQDFSGLTNNRSPLLKTVSGGVQIGF